jgi:ubiquinone/menaquinone biosynthesis C-methylase UbiE
VSDENRWQLDGTAPELYERYLVPAITSLWASDLIERLAPQRGEHILDVACGTGVVIRKAAEIVQDGRLVGLDMNAGMLATARQVAAGQIDWVEGSALDIPFPAASFDVVLCQLGLQFFPDRPKALSEMHRVLCDRGRIGLSVYSAIENTPVAAALADALDQHLAPGASRTKRAEHALNDPAELNRLVSEAGFHDVVINIVRQTLQFTSLREYVRLQLAATPMAGLVQTMSEERRNGIVDAITGSLAQALSAAGDGETLISSQEAFVVTARK